MTPQSRSTHARIVLSIVLAFAAHIAHSQTTPAERCAALLAEGKTHATPDPNDFKHALALWTEAFPICKSANVTPQLLAHSASLWATVLTTRGDRVAAESAYRDVISRIEHEYGANDPALLEPLNGLVDLTDSLGRTDESLLVAKHALAISEKDFGNASTQAAESLIMIGHLYEKKGDANTAEWFFRSAIEAATTACRTVPCRSLTAGYAALRNLIKTQPGRETEAKAILDLLMAQ